MMDLWTTRKLLPLWAWLLERHSLWHHHRHSHCCCPRPPLRFQILVDLLPPEATVPGTPTRWSALAPHRLASPAQGAVEGGRRSPNRARACGAAEEEERGLGEARRDCCSQSADPPPELLKRCRRREGAPMTKKEIHAARVRRAKEKGERSM